MVRKKKKSILPETAHLIVTGYSDFGDLTADMVKQAENHDKVKIYIAENRKIKPPLDVGDKFLARLVFRKNVYTAHPIVRTSQANPFVEYIYGVLEKDGNLLFVREAEKNSRKSYLVTKKTKAKDGDFVKVALEGVGRFKEVKVVRSYGKYNLNLATSTLILEKYNIPVDFSEKIANELANLPVIDKANRVDYTNVPFVTIDGEDSKDFDDAIAASKIDGGYKIYVAIADVAFYVREGSELDREAFKRGNSVYLPNITIPMLPKVLSNDLCSLMPNKERAAIVCVMDIDVKGNIRNHNFERAVIKSHARLTYKEAEDALEGKKASDNSLLLGSVLPDLYGAFILLNNARKKRGALEIDTKEVKIKLDKKGKVLSVVPVEIFTSNQIVEEFMIAANVAAASACEKNDSICMYRVHDKPREEKFKNMQPFLKNMKFKMPDVTTIKPEDFNKLLCKCEDDGLRRGINDLILRCQSQAVYSPKNIGHFGLALKKYAHFTSPIRRYADLLMHRALITVYNMQDGGGIEKKDYEQEWKEIATHISDMERRAVNVERDVNARFIADYMKSFVGQVYEGRISGLSNAGIFVSLEDIGAEGLVPMRSLRDDYYFLDESGFSLCGKYSNKSFDLGANIFVCLKEAVALTGSLIFDLVEFEKSKENKK